MSVYRTIGPLVMFSYLVFLLIILYIIKNVLTKIQLPTNIFQYWFASFALIRSKYILFSSVTIALATVRLAVSLAFCSVRIAEIIIGCINCAVLAENVVLPLLHWYYISRLGEHMGLLVEPRTQKRDVGGSISTSAVLCPLAKTHLLPKKYW